MSEKNVKTTIRLLGNDYTITSSSDSEEYMHRIAFYVDKKLTEVAERNNRLSTSMAAVLTSVNIADDLFKLRETLEEKEREMAALSDKLADETKKCAALKKDNDIKEQEIQRLKINIAKLEVRK